MTEDAAGIRLRLLDQVTWDGRPLTGDRAQALLAELTLSGRPVSDAALAASVWGDDVPAHPVKALQVLVSRVRSQTSPHAVARTEAGYRLGVDAAEVDALQLAGLADRAADAERRADLVAARDLAEVAVALPVPSSGGETALADLRDRARTDHLRAATVLGRVASALGDHDRAVAVLGALHDAGAELDEVTLEALLRSEGVVRGAPAALQRYERYRRGLEERLGVDPGPGLQAQHAELLRADRPVRTGLRFDSTSLVGRERDTEVLHGLLGTSRVTTILGPGGLGKTRLAHVLARGSEQSVVHFVELVGVVDPEDVVSEVGSALGVRDSVSGRSVLTPEQRRDVRGRIAQHLDQVPTLLVLDNAEHLVEAVADLVAFLVATVADLRVLVTSRSPLAIAAERVYPLGQLGSDEAVELFDQRARAARPGVHLDPRVVADVVARLDGLPLAIELAAAKVRVMSVEEIDRRLDDRFALLRGGDRSAPDRHQTLLAVIDWSWNLLDEPQRRSLTRLSAFNDGFALPAAEHVLAEVLDSRPAADLVAALADQSLVSVLEEEGGLRYRMLETVREFGRMRLAEQGEDEAAHDALVSWARDLCEDASRRIYTRDQIDVVDMLLVEEVNLADVLRRAIADGDQRTVAIVFAALGTYWTIRGDHPRVFTLTGAVDAALDGYEPRPDEVDAALGAAAITVVNGSLASVSDPAASRSLLRVYAEAATDPQLQALALVLGQGNPLLPGAPAGELASLADHPDKRVSSVALLWLSHLYENSGDPDRALSCATAALEMTDDDVGPWNAASLRTLLAGLHAQVGNHREVEALARQALPVLERLRADDDVLQVRAMLATAALREGRLDDAAELVDQVSIAARRTSGLGAVMVLSAAEAELALARGETELGLARLRRAVDEARELRFPGLVDPTGIEPWTIFTEALAVVAHAFAGSGAATAVESTAQALKGKAARLLAPDQTWLDFPITGMVLFAVGAWGLVREDLESETAIRLLALAERFAYSRFAPTFSWDRAVALAESAVPGALAAALAEYGTRRGPDLLEEARAATVGLADRGR
jgi:predicted ATPase/DNA-binding SARP family transcriptional activator/tetratricopeptide (TPR) repeat protein